MRNLLGGKAANLAEMSNLGLPGAAWLHHHDRGLHPFYAHRQILSRRPEATGRGRAGELGARMRARLAIPTRPLLVSVRSGARVSMPGMMDTVLNLGLNRSRRGSCPS